MMSSADILLANEAATNFQESFYEKFDKQVS